MSAGAREFYLMMHIKCSLIILYDSEKRFLLQHRTYDAEVMPGYWAFFGGGIKEGEKPRDAAVREGAEELGFNVKDPELFAEESFMHDGSSCYMYVFVAPFYEDKSLLRLSEGQGMGWFKLEQTEELKLIEIHRRILKKIDSHLGEQ